MIFHMDAALLFGGYQADGKGLHNGNQCHIRVSGNSNRPNVVGMEHLGYQNGGGAVRSADNADGSSILQVKAKDHCKEQGGKNTKLCRSAEQEQNGP